MGRGINVRFLWIPWSSAVDYVQEVTVTLEDSLFLALGKSFDVGPTSHNIIYLAGVVEKR